MTTINKKRTEQVNLKEKYQARTSFISFFFLVCSVILYFSWYKAKPYKYQEDFIILGLFWQIIGTVLLAGDALNVRWLQEKIDTHLFFFHSGWFCEYFDVKKHLKRIFTLDAKIITPFKMLIYASITILIFLMPYAIISKIPFSLLLKKYLSAIKYTWLVLGSLFLLLSESGINVIALLLKIFIFPLMLLIMLILSGPFALGEIAQNKFDIKKRYIAAGLVLVIYGALLQGIAAINWSDMRGSDYWHSNGIGRPVMAGDLLFKQSLSSMRKDELMYYDFWSNTMKQISDEFSNLIGFRFSGNYDKRFLTISLNKCDSVLRIAICQFKKKQVPTVFTSLNQITLQEIARLQKYVSKWQRGLDNNTKQPFQDIADDIWESIQSISEIIEKEVKTSFSIINNRKYETQGAWRSMLFAVTLPASRRPLLL